MENNKKWETYNFKINGFSAEIAYSSETVKNIFVPLVQKMTALQKQKNERLIVFLAAPPAVGKSTLAEFLSFLSLQNDGFTPIQAVGMDGFHYPAAYLKSHTISRNGTDIVMQSIKGAPETFDVQKLKQSIIAMKTQDILFPYYDRTLHDVVEDRIPIHEKIIVLEGNYLLLKEKPWKELKEYADYTIWISAEEDMLHQRLVNRKIKGGLTPEEAEAFYAHSDRKNILRVLENSAHGDLNLKMTGDMDYIKTNA